MLCSPTELMGWQLFSEYIRALHISGPLLKPYPLPGTPSLATYPGNVLNRNTNEFWLIYAVKVHCT